MKRDIGHVLVDILKYFSIINDPLHEPKLVNHKSLMIFKISVTHYLKFKGVPIV